MTRAVQVKTVTLLTAVMFVGLVAVPQPTLSDRLSPYEAATATSEDAARLLTLEFSPSGPPSLPWTLTITAHLAFGVNALYTSISSPDGSAQPPSGESWSHSRGYSSDTVTESFQVSPSLSPVVKLTARVTSDWSYHYLLRNEYAITMPNPAIGHEPPLVARLLTVTCCVDSQDVVPEQPTPAIQDPDNPLSGIITLSTGDDAAAQSYGGETRVWGFLHWKIPGEDEYTVCKRCHFKLWDSDGSSNRNYLASGVTHFDGYFDVIVDNVDGYQGIDPFLEVFSGPLGTGYWPITVTKPSGSSYSWDRDGLAIRSQCPDGTCRLGDAQGDVYYDGPNDMDEAMWVWINGIKSWRRINYWDNAYEPDRVQFVYPAESITGHAGTHIASTAHYHRDLKEIHVGTDHVRNRHTLAHEYGHHVMYDAYGYASTGHSCPSPHRVSEASSPGCAWVEGWADFFGPNAFYGYHRYYNDGSYYNLETRASGGPFADGDDVEGNVAAALHDLVDSTNDGYDSGIDYDFVLHVHDSLYTNGVDRTFDEFAQAWEDNGLTWNDIRGAARQNTILL